MGTRRADQFGWTKEIEQTVKDLRLGGLGCKEIADKIGVTKNAIIGKLSRLGVKIDRNMDNPWTDAELEAVKKHWGQGRTAPEISQIIFNALNLIRTRRSIGSKVRRLGLPKRPAKFRTSKARLPIIPAGKLPPDFKSLEIPFMELENFHCREVTGRGADSLATFCGHRKLLDCSFCEAHARINFQPQELPQLLARAA